jgi:eukaryotic-like serine/threonine-protein kinase
MEGRVIAGRYRLSRTLGHGSMGTVWLAEHLTLRTDVAIKIMGERVLRDSSARVRFEREAHVAARLTSRHIVRVFDHGETDSGELFMAMEHLVGESLRDRLRARKRLPIPETARIVSHLCRAVIRAHEAGLVHRDLKPENIFIVREDDDDVVKVLDFGLAKATDPIPTGGADPTRTGALLGTPFYMSPEQAQGLKTIDHRSDLWTLGVVVFECLTGKRLFRAASLIGIIEKVLADPIPAPSEVAPDAGIPPELDVWMKKALSRAPDERFGSARELAESFMIAAGVADSMDRISLTSVPPPGPSPEDAKGLPGALPAQGAQPSLEALAREASQAEEGSQEGAAQSHSDEGSQGAADGAQDRPEPRGAAPVVDGEGALSAAASEVAAIGTSGEVPANATSREEPANAAGGGAATNPASGEVAPSALTEAPQRPLAADRSTARWVGLALALAVAVAVAIMAAVVSR